MSSTIKCEQLTEPIDTASPDKLSEQVVVKIEEDSVDMDYPVSYIYAKLKDRKEEKGVTPTCRFPWSIESPERTDRKQELSVNTVAYISCRSNLIIMLVGAARGVWEAD